MFNSRNRGYHGIEHLKEISDKTKRIEEEIRKYKFKKRFKYFMKWRPFIDDLI